MAKLVEKKPEEVAVKVAEEQIRSMMKETMGRVVPVIPAEVAVQRADKEASRVQQSLTRHAEKVDSMLPESVREREMLKNELRVAYAETAEEILARDMGLREREGLERILGRGRQALEAGQTDQAQLQLLFASRYDEAEPTKAGLALQRDVENQSRELAEGKVTAQEAASSLSSQYKEQLMNRAEGRFRVRDEVAASTIKSITDGLIKERPGIGNLRNAATAASIAEQVRAEEIRLARDIKKGICASSVREGAMKMMRRSLDALEKGLPSEIATIHLELGKRYRTSEPEMRKHLSSMSQMLEKADIKALETPIDRPDASLRLSAREAKVAGQEISEGRITRTDQLFDMVASYLSLLDHNRGRAWPGSFEMEAAINATTRGMEGSRQFDRGLARYRFGLEGRKIEKTIQDWHGNEMAPRKGLIEEAVRKGEELAAKGDIEGVRSMFALAAAYIDTVKRDGLLDKKGRVVSLRDEKRLEGMEQAMTAMLQGKDSVAGRDAAKVFWESFSTAQAACVDREAAALERIAARREVGAETIKDALSKAREKAAKGDLRSAFTTLQYIKDYYGVAERGRKEGWRYNLIAGRAAAYVPDYVTGRKEILEAISKEADSQSETTSEAAGRLFDQGTGRIANILMLSSDYNRIRGIHNGEIRIAKGIEAGKVPLGKRRKDGTFQAYVGMDAVRRYGRENPYDTAIWTGKKEKDRMVTLEHRLEQLDAAVKKGNVAEYRRLSEAYWNRLSLLAARTYRKERVEEARKVLGQCNESLLESLRAYAVEAYGEGDVELGMARFDEARRNAKIEWGTSVDNRGVMLREQASSEAKGIYDYLVEKYGEKPEHSRMASLVELSEQTRSLSAKMHNMEDTKTEVPLDRVSSLLDNVQSESRDTVIYSHLSSKIRSLREYERKLEGRAGRRARDALILAREELENVRDITVQRGSLGAAVTSYDIAMERMMDAMVLYEAKGAVTLRSFGEMGDRSDFRNYKDVEMKAFMSILAGKGNRRELETRLRGARMVEVSIFSIPADAGSQLFADYTAEQAGVRQLVAKASTAKVAEANRILDQSDALFRKMQKNVEDHRFWTNVGVSVVGIGVSLIPGGQTLGGAIFTTMAADQVVTEFKMMGTVSWTSWLTLAGTVATIGAAGLANITRAEALGAEAMGATRYASSMMNVSKGLSYATLGVGAGFSAYMGYHAKEAFETGDMRGGLFSLSMMLFPFAHMAGARTLTGIRARIRAREAPQVAERPVEAVRAPVEEVAPPARPEAFERLRAAAERRKAEKILREVPPEVVPEAAEVAKRADSISKSYEKEPAQRAKNEQAMVDWVESVAERRGIPTAEAIELVARHEAILTPVVEGEKPFIGMPKWLLRKAVRQPDGKKTALGRVPKATLRARIDDTIKTSGSTAGVFEGTVEGQTKAIKVFKDPCPEEGINPTRKEWSDLQKRVQKEVDSLKVLSDIKVDLPGRGEVPLGPKIDGFVDVDGNLGISLELLGTKKSPALAIDEMTPQQVRRHVGPETYDQLRRMWNKLTAEGYEISDFQFGVLTKDQVVNGVPRKAGDVVFWDAGSLAETSQLNAQARKLSKRTGIVHEHETPTADYQLRRATNRAELIITDDLMFDVGKKGQKTLKKEFKKDEAALRRFLKAAVGEGRISEAEQAVSRMGPEEAARVRETLERAEERKLRVKGILGGKEKIKESNYQLMKEFIVMGGEARIPAAERVLSRMNPKDSARVRKMLEHVEKASFVGGQVHPGVRTVARAEVVTEVEAVAVGAREAPAATARRIPEVEVPTRAARVKPMIKEAAPEVAVPREMEAVPPELLDMVREGRSPREAIDALFDRAFELSKKNPAEARQLETNARLLERMFGPVMLEGTYQKRFLMATPQEQALVLEAMPKVRNIAEAFDAMAQRMAPTTAEEISAYAKNLRSRIKSGELTREEVGLRLDAIEKREHGLGGVLKLMIREETPTHVLEGLPKRWESARDSIKRVDLITKAREARAPEQVRAAELELIRKAAKTPAEQAKLARIYGKGGMGGRVDVLESLGIEAFRTEARRATTPEKVKMLESKTAGFFDMLLRGNLESQISENVAGFEGTTIKKVGYLGGLRGVYTVEMSNGKGIFVKPEGADAAMLGRDITTRRGLFTSEMYPWRYKTDLKIEFKGREEAVMQEVTIIKDIRDYTGSRATIRRPTGEMMENRLLLGIDMMGGNRGTEILANPTPANPVHEIFFSLMSIKEGRQIGCQAWRAYHEIARRSGLIDRFLRNSAFVISGKEGLALTELVSKVREKGPPELVEMIKKGDAEVTFQPIDMDFLAGRVKPAMQERYFTEKGETITKAEAEARAARGEETTREELPDFDLSGFNGDFEEATRVGFIDMLPDAMKKASEKKLFKGEVPTRQDIAQDMLSETAEIGARLAPDSEGMNEITRKIIERHNGKPVGAGFDASGSTSPESAKVGDLMAYGDYAPIADIDGRIMLDSKDMLGLYKKLWSDAAQQEFLKFQNERIAIDFGLKKPDVTVPMPKMSMQP